MIETRKTATLSAADVQSLLRDRLDVPPDAEITAWPRENEHGHLVEVRVVWIDSYVSHHLHPPMQAIVEEETND